MDLIDDDVSVSAQVFGVDDSLQQDSSCHETQASILRDFSSIHSNLITNDSSQLHFSLNTNSLSDRNSGNSSGLSNYNVKFLSLFLWNISILFHPIIHNELRDLSSFSTSCWSFDDHDIIHTDTFNYLCPSLFYGEDFGRSHGFSSRLNSLHVSSHGVDVDWIQRNFRHHCRHGIHCSVRRSCFHHCIY